MNRKYLVSCLDFMQVALDNRPVIPILGYVCFTGKEMYSFDNVMALVFPMETDFTCGVIGSTFTQLVKSSGAEDVKISFKADVITLHIGKSRFKIPHRPAEEFVLDIDFDKANAHQSHQLTPQWLDALQFCSRTMLRDLDANPNASGVLIDLERGYMYSSDRASLSEIEIEPQEEQPIPSFLLWTDFVNTILRISRSYKGDMPPELYVFDDKFIIEFEDLCTVQCAVISQEPLDFASVVDKMLEAFSEFEDPDTIFTPAPDELFEAFKRAEIMLDGRGVDYYSKLTTNKKTLKIDTVSTKGDGEDTLPFKSTLESECAVRPDLLLKFQKDCTTIAVLEDRIVLRGEPAKTVYVGGVSYKK